MALKLMKTVHPWPPTGVTSWASQMTFPSYHTGEAGECHSKAGGEGRRGDESERKRERVSACV